MSEQFAACLIVELHCPACLIIFRYDLEDVTSSRQITCTLEFYGRIPLPPCRDRRQHLAQVVSTIAIDELIRHRRAHVETDKADGLISANK